MDDEVGRLFPLPPGRARSRRIKLRPAKDASIELREFGAWTLEKLRVFELYLKQYRRVAGNGSYIDGFAGTGSIAVARRSGEEKGSARLAMDAKAFKRLWFFEKDTATFGHLESNLKYHYTDRRRAALSLVNDDFNHAIVPILERREIPDDKPCFAFLDPNSTELAWTTVERLAHYKQDIAPPRRCKIELWILFNSHQAFSRLVDRQGSPGYAASPRAATLDRVMGGRDAWWDLYESGAHINHFARRYADRLRESLDYGFAHAQLVRDPGTGAPQYFMIHASDHPAAWDFMRWAKRTSCYSDNTAMLPGFER